MAGGRSCQRQHQEEEEQGSDSDEEVSTCSQSSSSSSCFPCSSAAASTSAACCGGARLDVQTPPLCMKCKQNAAQLLANQTERLCKHCLHLSLSVKFKTALNQHAALHGSDRVLVAFSGGPGSRVALQFLCEIQAKLRDDASSRKDRNLHVFDLGVAFVDETLTLGIPCSDSCLTLTEIASAVTEARQDPLPLHVSSLESLFSDEESRREDGDECGRRLIDLLSRVRDQTGKEDLVEHMRMDVLQRLARHHGYTRIVTGRCTTRIAACVLSATAKGEGYSLPAGIQYVDARWPVPVIQPLRDCVAKELAGFCHLTSLKTVYVKNMITMGKSQASINSLTHSFISLINQENPSREYTIMRTATKLSPFSFNNLAHNGSAHTSNGRVRRRDSSGDSTTAQPPGTEVFCPICCAPIAQSEFSSLQIKDGSLTRLSLRDASVELFNLGQDFKLLPSNLFRSVCCPCCQFQIIPEQSKDSMLQLLPSVVHERSVASLSRKAGWMREHISDFLIESDDHSLIPDF